MQYSEICSRITSLHGSHPLSLVFSCKTSIFGPELQVSMGPRPHLSFCACKTVGLTSELLVSMGPSPHVWLLDAKQRLLDPNNKSIWAPDIICRFVHAIQRDLLPNNLSLWVPPLISGFFMQNSDFWSGITSLYGSHTKPVVLYMQNSVISTRITSLYGFQRSSVVFASKTATLGPDLQVCMCPSPKVWYWALVTAFLEQEYQVYVGLQPSPVVLCLQNGDFRTSLCGSQTSPVIFCMQNSVPNIRITSLYGSQPSFEVFACKTTTFVPK